MSGGKVGRTGVSNYANVTTGLGARAFAVSGGAYPPSGLRLSTTQALVGTSVGATIALISAFGNSPFSYTILSDPDGKFSITAPDMLVLAVALSPVTLSHTVQLRATNSYGSFDRTFVITVVV